MRGDPSRLGILPRCLGIDLLQGIEHAVADGQVSNHGVATTPRADGPGMIQSREQRGHGWLHGGTDFGQRFGGACGIVPMLVVAIELGSRPASPGWKSTFPPRRTEPPGNRVRSPTRYPSQGSPPAWQCEGSYL